MVQMFSGQILQHPCGCTPSSQLIGKVGGEFWVDLLAVYQSPTKRTLGVSGMADVPLPRPADPEVYDVMLIWYVVHLFGRYVLLLAPRLASMKGD